MKSIKFRLKLYLVVFAVLMAVGIAGFIFIEKMSLTDAVYFSIVTMATVGYGDIHPQTQIGKVLALVIIVGGVGTFLGIIASVTDLFVNRREEALRQQKIDMLTGLFFSEMGNALLKQFIRFDTDTATLGNMLKISAAWGDADFDRACGLLKKRRFSIDSRRGDLPALFSDLQKRTDLLLRLIENPILQEHADFTELLRSLFHLRDELMNRTDLVDILDSDRKHLDGDIARAYDLLIFEWLRYVRYLKENYGYLFSLAVRLNPFDPEATPVVTTL